MATIDDGGQLEMDLSDSWVWYFDWTGFLASGVEMIDDGELTVTCYSRPEEVPALFALDNISRISGNRVLQFRMIPGGLGLYRIAHKIVTNELIPETFERSYFVCVSQR